MWWSSKCVDSLGQILSECSLAQLPGSPSISTNLLELRMCPTLVVAVLRNNTVIRANCEAVFLPRSVAAFENPRQEKRSLSLGTGATSCAPLLQADLLLRTSDRKKSALPAAKLAWQKSEVGRGERGRNLPVLRLQCVSRATSSPGERHLESVLSICAAPCDVLASQWSALCYFGFKNEAHDCSAVMGISTLVCSLARMGAILSANYESDFPFLLR